MATPIDPNMEIPENPIEPIPETYQASVVPAPVGRPTFANAAEEYDYVAANEFDPRGNAAEDAQRLQGVRQQIDIKWKKIAASGQVTNDQGDVGQLEQASFAQRSSLPAAGTPNTAASYWDAARGVMVNAPYGQHFLLYPNGAVRNSPGPVPAGQTKTGASSLFDQPTMGGPNGQMIATPGFRNEQLGITPAEGKTIARTGQSGKNPKTGVDVLVADDEIFIEYTDGTYEIRKNPNINEAGTPQDIGLAGKSAEELGITRRTSIMGGPGTEVTRAPMSAAEALAQAKTPEEKDAVIMAEGGISTKDLQLVGKTYRGKTAAEGNMFYVDPKTKEILERPEALQSLAQPLKIPGVAGTKLDVVSKFQAVFGREPNNEELKYWMGRTDKVGNQLIGAMQFAKQTGQAIGKTTAPTPSDPVEALKAEANASQAKRAAMYAEAGITTGSDNKKALRASIESMKPPESESLREFTKDQLAATQFQEATNDLNRAKDSLRRLDADYQSNIEASERTPGLSMGAIRRNQNEIDVSYNRARRDLVAEVQMYSDIVQSQTTMMGLMIDAFKYDQNAAQVDYQNRFNKAMAVYEMVSTEERDEFNMSQKLQDNQRANLSVLTGLISEGRINYDTMSPDAKAQISMMEAAVGLNGLTQAIAKTPMPKVMSVGSTITDENGNLQTQLISQDPRTGELTISYYKAPFKEKRAGGGSGSGDILGGLGGLLNGVMAADSPWKIKPAQAATAPEPPPWSGIPGTKVEYSGYIWEADNKGNWI